MKHSISAKFALLAMLLFIAAALVMPTAPAFGAPLAQANLLTNADFEAFSGNTPNNWTTWYSEGGGFGKPEYKRGEGNRAKAGNSASYWSSFFKYDGGFYQTVTVTNGQNYRFTVSAQGVTDPTGNNIQFRIGIDPKGGTNATAASVKWSAAKAPMGAFQDLTLDAVAEGTTITVFLRSSNDNAVQASESFWDNANLIAATAAPTNTPGPTVAPTAGGGCTPNSVPIGSIPISTPQPDGSIVHVVARCETLFGISTSYQVDPQQIRQLNNMTTDVIQVGQRLTIQGPTAQVQPTAAPTNIPPTQDPNTVAEVPTNAPQATEAPLISTGSICVRSYSDLNANGSREPQEPNQAGITFALNSGESTVDTFTTDETTDAHCFDDLTSGSYTVSWAAEGFEPTSDQIWVANLTPGSTVQHDFGVAIAGTVAEGTGEPDTAAPTSGGGLPRVLTAAVAALGVVFFLVGLSAAGYFLFLRQRQG